jgi:SOS-response transcriptional repressor LexA
MPQKQAAKPAMKAPKNLGERVLFMLAKRGMSQAQLAAKAGMSQQSVNYLVQPGHTEKRSERVVEMALALECDPVWLATGLGQATGGGAARIVPLVNYEQLHHVAAMLEKKRHDLLQSLSESVTYVDSKVSPDAFAIPLWDDCMVPVVRPGDRIVIDPQVKASPGEPVVACIEASRVQFVFRIYKPVGVVKGRDVFELIPRNPEHATINSADTKVRIVGAMIEAHTYRPTRGGI